MGAMWWRVWRGARNTVRHFVFEQPLRGLSIIFVLLVVWGLLGGLFWGLLAFLGQEQYQSLKPRLLETLLATFFFALFFLVTMSGTVLVWGNLFRTRPAVFHAQLPLTDRALFWCAGLEGGLWASWAILVLGLPLVGILMREAINRPLYIAVALTVLLLFVACCVAGGSIGALLLARLIPLLRRGMRGIILVVCSAFAVGAVFVISSLEEHSRPTTFMHEVIGRLAFAENPYLPPWWTQQALTAAMTERWSDCVYYLALLASTAAFLAVIGESLAVRRLRRDIDELSGRPDERKRSPSKPWRPLPFLPADIALLAAKDLRLFVRDPAQVLQFTMFFGLLGFYLLMLPRLGRAFMFDEWWRPAVSLLNLTAITMALATFTGRFVYPLLSLEGRRLWILVLAPWPRTRVVTAKFAFALVVGVPVSLFLVILSGGMLDLPVHVIAYQGLVIVCMATGLAAGALGLGARLADYGQDNPAKLVAGYGGTINLLASLVFSGMLLLGATVPFIGSGMPWRWVVGLVWTLAVAGIYTTVALNMAWRWFARS
jgi:ABC-2 type transport system permease protein